MKTKLLQLSIIALSLLAASCGGNKSETTFLAEDNVETILDANEVKVEKSLINLRVFQSKKTKLAPDYSNLEQFKADINTYRLKFKSKAGFLNNIQILCEKMNLSKNKRYIVQTTIHQAKEGELNLDLYDNDPNETSFLCEIKDGEENIDRIKITLLKSYIISKNSNWSTHLPTQRIDSLLIEEDAALYSYDMSQVLEAQTFISLNGSIETFPKEEKNSSTPNSNGKSGGTIIILAQEAIGNLKVELRGLDAGTRTVVPSKNTTKIEKNKNANGCKPESHQAPKNESLCHGLKGFPGKPGAKGFPGLNGGDSGALFLKVALKSNLGLTVNYTPGKSSPGGLGGEGSDGGEGSQGSYVTWTKEHVGRGGDFGGRGFFSFKESTSSRSEKRYPNGAWGDQGPRGENGVNGQDGKNLESEIDLDDFKTKINEFYTTGEAN